MNESLDVFEQIRTYLPKYLSPPETKQLFEGLASFPAIKSYYLHRSDLRDELLQGDGWRGLVVISFSSGERKPVSGLILSNSCDLVTQSASDPPGNVLFAPLVALSKYADRLRAAGKNDEQVISICESIRRQEKTSIFCLPAYEGVIEESIVLLDDIHGHPLADFLGRERVPLFKLNQVAFYLLLMKLSIHFSRFLEGVKRFDNTA